MTSTDKWNPSQYEKFARERRLPFDDLFGMVRVDAGARVIDLGCGTGELTRTLHLALRAGSTLGLDNSPAMLGKAEKFTAPGLSFALQSIADFAPDEKFDLVFSNAALHWVEDHESLFARVANWIVPGGELAVQMPANHDHPSHALAAALAREEPYAAAHGMTPRASPVQSPEWYARLLHRLGFTAQRVQLNVYPHLLENRDGLLEWVRGTLLTWYESRLPAELFAKFLDDYHTRLRAHFADARPFFYPFKRVLIWGRK